MYKNYCWIENEEEIIERLSDYYSFFSNLKKFGLVESLKKDWDETKFRHSRNIREIKKIDRIYKREHYERMKRGEISSLYRYFGFEDSVEMKKSLKWLEEHTT